LEPPEQALLDHAFNGTRLDFVGEGRVGHEEMKEWGSSRTVRAAVLRHLLIDPQWQVDSKGVRLRGARITGRLDLESAVVRWPLVLANCYLDSPDPVVLAYATASRIVLTRCRVVGGLAADLVVVSKQLDLSGSAFEGVVLLSGADITGELLCRGAELTGADFDGNALAADRIKVDGDTVFDRATATGAVRLLGAHIIGQLSWRNAHLTGTDRDGDALIGDRMRVGGSVFLDQQFTAAGAVRLPGVDIVGQLSCRGAELTGTDSDGNALGGDGMKVGGGVFFDQATAAGAVRLLDADITGSLSWRKAQLTGADRNSNALIGDRMKVDGSVSFDQATAAGAVRLLDADITGELSCGGAQLTGTDRDGDALIGDRMKVASDVFLDQQFTAAGAVCLRAARIAGSVWLNGAELAESVALRAVGVYVAGQLHWAPRSPVRGLVNLERAAVHRLDDNWGLPDAHWPPAGRLRLAGFTYEGFGGQHRASWRQRLDWIRRSHTTATGTAPAVFAGQPYEQLVRVYRQMGHESQARHVAIARPQGPASLRQPDPPTKAGQLAAGQDDPIWLPAAAGGRGACCDLCSGGPRGLGRPAR
jgi:uncharacterized protein YjbI with pentapeptide repeats